MAKRMTREELNKVFDWLEENMNKTGWLEFKVTADNNITAYIKGNKKTFANFYTKQILKIINGELGKEPITYGEGKIILNDDWDEAMLRGFDWSGTNADN